MKKFTKIGYALTAILIAGALTATAFAVSDPEDNAEEYSYNTGLQSYEARMAEDHAWYDNEDNEDDSAAADYSFNEGTQAALSISDAFEDMPEEENMEEEDIEAWFESSNIGEGSAWSNGQYDESAKSSYSYAVGKAAYQQRHASYSVSD